jgi:hypothetical protein
MKVGSFQIPEYRLNEDLVDALKKIYDKYKGEEATDHNTIAILIGHKSPSGPYYVRIASLRGYGLLEKRGVKVTQLGKTIAYPRSDEERDTSFKEALLNIPLWKLFFTEFGVNLPKEKFWVDLQRIAGIEAPDAQKLENPVRNAYIGDAKNLKTVEKPAEPPEPQKGETRIKGSLGRINIMEPQAITSAETIGYIGYPEYSQAPIEIKDIVSYEIAQKLLDAIGAKLGILPINQKKDISKPGGSESKNPGESDVKDSI